MTFNTKQGKALAAAFDPDVRDAVTRPRATERPVKDDDGEVVVHDRAAGGLIYRGHHDTKQPDA